MTSIALEERLGEVLRQRGLTLGLAESCTGGLIGHRLTNVPGSSEYFVGGVIAYANHVKHRLLGVPQKVLDQYGAVSQETVEAMAQGVSRLFRTDIGLSVSGIAGPGGGTPEKPVGTVWVGLCLSGEIYSQKFLFAGDRLAVKTRSAVEALRFLLAKFGE